MGKVYDNKMKKVINMLRSFLSKVMQEPEKAQIENATLINEPTYYFVHPVRRDVQEEFFIEVDWYGTDVKEYDRIVNALAPNDGKIRPLSRAGAENLLKDTIVNVKYRYENGEPLDQVIEEELYALRQKLLSAPQEWTVWIPISGIKIGERGFTFGKVFFCNSTHEAFTQAYDTLFNNKDHTNQLLLGAKDTKKVSLRDATKALLHEAEEVCSSYPLARITVQAHDKTAAEELALADLRTTMDVLNFLHSLTPPDYFRAVTYAPADRAHPHTFVLVFPTTTDANPYLRKVAPTRVKRSQLDWDQLRESPRDQLLQRVFECMNALLRDEGEEQLRNRVVAAMKWAGKGANADYLEDALAWYMIALETLLLGGRSVQSKSATIEARVRALLGTTERMKDLYGLRSAIVHSGKTEIAETDVRNLINYTNRAIVQILLWIDEGTIKTHGDLENRFQS